MLLPSFLAIAGFAVRLIQAVTTTASNSCTKNACYTAFANNPTDQFCTKLDSPTPLPLPSFASAPCGGWWSNATSVCHCLYPAMTVTSSSTSDLVSPQGCTHNACYSAFLNNPQEQFCALLGSPTPLPLPSFASSPCGGWWNSATSVCSCLSSVVGTASLNPTSSTSSIPTLKTTSVRTSSILKSTLSLTIATSTSVKASSNSHPSSVSQSSPTAHISSTSSPTSSFISRTTSKSQSSSTRSISSSHAASSSSLSSSRKSSSTSQTSPKSTSSTLIRPSLSSSGTVRSTSSLISKTSQSSVHITSTTAIQGAASVIPATSCPTTPAASLAYVSAAEYYYDYTANKPIGEIKQTGYSISNTTQVYALSFNTSTFWYTSPESGTITAVSDQGDSFTYDATGGFVYTGAGCKYEISGTTAAQRQSRSIMPKNILLARDIFPSYTVDITLFNQCGQPKSGLSPHLLCYTPYGLYGSESSVDTSPSLDFLDSGNGLYTGTCPLPILRHSLCELGSALCSNTGQVLLGKIADGPCAIVAELIGAAATAETGGIALPAAVFLESRITSLCSFALGTLLNEICSYEYPVTGPTCEPPQFEALISVDYLNGMVASNGPPTSILASVTGYSTNLVTTTATAYEETCTIVANPLPSGVFQQCPAGQVVMTTSIKICDGCYTYGDDPYWKSVTDPAYDVWCNLCCGCCYPVPLNPTHSVQSPSDPSLCCTPDPNSIWYCADQCVWEFQNGYGCTFPNAKQVCQGQTAGFPQYPLCRDSNEYYVFDTSTGGKCETA